MKALVRHAEQILDIASAGNGEAGDLAIVVGHEGGMRMVEPQGWSLAALCAEYGAPAAYKVERRGRVVRVEGWGGGERCLLQRATNARQATRFPGCAELPSGI
jgi:hypothetical protein